MREIESTIWRLRMTHSTNAAIAALVLLVCCSCSTVFGESQDHARIELADSVEVEELLPGVWLYTTYMEVAGYGKVGGNGLIVINEQTAAMIDLPWTNGQTGVLFDWVKGKHNATVQTVVPTHSHLDCAGGLAEAHRRGANSIAQTKTIELLALAKKPLPRESFVDSVDVKIGDIRIKLPYLGGGHTVDNIVAWIPEHRVLFAGCLLKGRDFKSIGNTADADLDSYPRTLAELRQKYRNAIIVVPGHGKPGGLEIIDHTENMLRRHIEHRSAVDAAQRRD